jgi:hypothetical protein
MVACLGERRFRCPTKAQNRPACILLRAGLFWALLVYDIPFGIDHNRKPPKSIQVCVVDRKSDFSRVNPKLSIFENAPN